MNRYSPLLSQNTPLDHHSRQLIEELSRREYEKSLTLPTDEPLDQKRRKRVGYTWDEMWEQPEKIRETLSLEGQMIREAASQLGSTPINRVIMAGCGDSWSSMVAVRFLYESLLGIPCEPIQALDFAYYYHLPINDKTLVVVLSSSGATTRVVEALMIAKMKGAKSLALSNTAGSPLMEEADQGILIHAERKGWPTQSSTSAMAILYQFGVELARVLNASKKAEIDGLEKALHETPKLIADALQTHTEAIAGLAQDEADHPLYLYTAGGPCYASAMIGAAKVKECSPSHAIAIPLEEYHHYNSQKSDEPLFLIAPSGLSVPRALDTAREGKRVGGRVYSVVCKDDDTLKDASDLQFLLPAIDERLAPMVYTVPLQLFAYHVAMAKFHLAENLAD
jgi:glucosamine--fructose-6-phosphate aminotransferase (isomerizing)